jgi:hypothetical protein
VNLPHSGPLLHPKAAATQDANPPVAPTDGGAAAVGGCDRVALCRGRGTCKRCKWIAATRVGFVPL